MPIFQGEKEHRSVDERFDYVIIGSGAAGATAARILADTGASIAIVEEGPYLKTSDFGDTLLPAFKNLFRNMGAQVARGRAMIPVLQGRALGGSTVINSAIIWRIPDDVWQPWKTEWGLGDALPLDALHTCWDQIEEELHVKPVDEAVWGNNNRKMAEASQKLGVSAHPIRRGDTGCKGSARCLTGCPHGAKQSMLVSYIPYALERGATVFTGARARRVRVSSGHARAVEGHFVHPLTGRRSKPFTLRARKGVIVAASAIQTPGILRRSGVRSPHLGEHFQGHPGGPLMGLFDEEINLWFGATQGYDADHHRQDRRYKIETLALPPEMAFARMPGVGRRYLDHLMLTRHMTFWAAQIRSYGKGRVRDTPFGVDITFELTRQDMDNLRHAYGFMAKMLFAVGARELLVPVSGMPERIGPDELHKLDDLPADPGAYSMILSHLFGTARMSTEARNGVVGTDFTVHGTSNLYVLDSSVFPTNLGVNPQHAIMGVAMHGARQIADRHTA